MQPRAFEDISVVSSDLNQSLNAFYVFVFNFSEGVQTSELN